VRYRPDTDCACQALLLIGEDCWPASVRNVSVDGICLVLNAPFPPGTRCQVDLVNKLGLFARRLPMQVAHISRMDNNQYLVGGPFVEAALLLEEVRALLT
jgi:hypothetical protein